MIYSANKKICLPSFVQMVHNEGYVLAITLTREVPTVFYSVFFTLIERSTLCEITGFTTEIERVILEMALSIMKRLNKA